MDSKLKVQEFMIRTLAHELQVEKSYNKNLEGVIDSFDDFQIAADAATKIDNRTIN